MAREQVGSGIHLSSAELVHGVMCAACLQSGFTGEILLVVVTDIGAGHILVSYACYTLTDFLTLHAQT